MQQICTRQIIKVFKKHQLKIDERIYNKPPAALVIGGYFYYANLCVSVSRGINGYEVYRSTSSSSTYTKVKKPLRKATPILNLRRATYYYKVRAYRTVSGKKVYGSFFSIKSAKP